MRRIIVPTDFSKQSEYALDLAVEISKKTGADILVLHVIEYQKKSSVFLGSTSIDTEATLSTGADMDDTYFLLLFRKRKQDLINLLGQEKYDGMDLKNKILMGTPYHAIDEEITNQDSDLIIMGTTGISDWEESLIGSTAEKVVRHARCPVMTLREEVHYDNISDIVFAHDFFEKSSMISMVPKSIQEFFQAKIHFLYVNTPSNFKSEREGLSAMKRFAEENGFTNYQLDFYSHYHEDEGVIAFAEDNKMDMIMMSTAGRSGIFRFFERSITEDVVNLSKKPVLSYNLAKKKK